MPGKTAEEGQHVWEPAPTGETWMAFQVLDFGVAWSSCYRHMGSETGLILSLKQVNRYLKKKFRFWIDNSFDKRQAAQIIKVDKFMGLAYSKLWQWFADSKNIFIMCSSDQTFTTKPVRNSWKLARWDIFVFYVSRTLFWNLITTLGSKSIRLPKKLKTAMLL